MIHRLVACDLVVGSPISSDIAAPPTPRKRAPRRPTLASALKAAAKHNASVEVDPATGWMTLRPGGATASVDATANEWDAVLPRDRQ